MKSIAKVFQAARTIIRLLPSVLAILSLSSMALSQSPASHTEPMVPKLDDIAISPSRLELPMMPGTEKTVVVNLIYTAETGHGQPTRVIAYLGDWGISQKGKVVFYPAGSQANSASSWLVYSPTEVTVESGRVHPIRVTISVPKDATPGDHLAALFVESRPESNKLENTRKQLQVKFRLAAVFYIMVPNLTRKGSLASLTSQIVESGIAVTPRLENSGNSHIRPTYSIRVFDQHGTTVVETAETESLPVLANSEMQMPVTIEKRLPAGNYSVRYRVKFDDGGPVTEGQADMLIEEKSVQHIAPAKTTDVQGTKSVRK
jgi:methionine-rich copper-binding protein CopC